MSQFVRRGKTPQLIPLSIAMFLVVALGGCATVKSDTQTVIPAKAVVPRSIDISLMMRRAIDGEAAELLRLLVIHTATSLQITVATAQRELLCSIPFHAEIKARGIGILQILILLHQLRLILDYIFSWSLR